MEIGKKHDGKSRVVVLAAPPPLEPLQAAESMMVSKEESEKMYGPDNLRFIDISDATVYTDVISTDVNVQLPRGVVLAVRFGRPKKALCGTRDRAAAGMTAQGCRRGAARVSHITRHFHTEGGKKRSRCDRTHPPHSFSRWSG